MSAFAPKADKRHPSVYVRFLPKATKRNATKDPPASSVGGTSRVAGKDSRNGTLWNIWRDRADHSALMFAERITLAHFSVSSAISLPKSAGETASTSPP